MAMNYFGSKFQRWWHVGIGIPLVFVGISIVKPAGFLDALLSALNKRYNLELTLSQPPAYGFATIALGVAVIAWREFTLRKFGPKKLFLAFCHRSLEPFVTSLDA